MEKCIKCGLELVPLKPSYIPIGTDEIMELQDYTCKVCGGAYIGVDGKSNVTCVIKNRELHDKLVNILGNVLQDNVNGKEFN